MLTPSHACVRVTVQAKRWQGHVRARYWAAKVKFTSGGRRRRVSRKATWNRSLPARAFPPPRGRRPCARTEVTYTGAGRSRLWPWEMVQGPRCESERNTTATHGGGKSDRLIVAKKRSNKDNGAPGSAENVEPSSLTKGNSFRQNRFRTPCRGRFDMDNSKRARSEKSRTQPRDRAYVEPADLQRALERIRQAQRLRVTTRGRSPVR